MTAPGDVVPCDWNDRPHLAVVLATSRHKRTLTPEEAVPLLADEFLRYLGDASEDLRARLIQEILPLRPYDWRSVTRTEVEEGTHECSRDCGEGDRCTAGSGAAWWTVLSYGTSEAERLRL